jgi:hypothetical protein
MFNFLRKKKPSDMSVTIRAELSTSGVREAIDYEYAECHGKIHENDNSLPICTLGTESSIYICKKCKK